MQQSTTHLWSKLKNKTIYHTFVTVQKSNRNIVVRGKIDNPNALIWQLFSWLRTGNSIKGGGVKLVFRAQMKWCSHASVFYVCVKCQPQSSTVVVDNTES